MMPRGVAMAGCVDSTIAAQSMVKSGIQGVRVPTRWAGLHAQQWHRMAQ